MRSLTSRPVAPEPAYTVRYYYEKIEDDTFVEDISLAVTGQEKEGETVTAVTDGKYLKEGFVLAEDAEGYRSRGEVLADGSLELNIFYRRIRSDVTLLGDPDGAFTADKSQTVKFGDTVTLSAADRAGYDKAFSVYKTDDENTAVPVSENSFTMPAYDVTAELAYTARTDRPYTISYYYETLAGDYAIDSALTVTGLGATGANVDAETDGDFVKTGYELDPDADGYMASGVLPGEGTLELKVYYSLIRSEVNIVSDVNGEISADKTENVCFGETVTVTAMPAQGYITAGVYVNGSTESAEKTGENQYAFQMPAEAVEVAAGFGNMANPIDVLAAGKIYTEKVDEWQGDAESVYRISRAPDKIVFDQAYSNWLTENYAGISYKAWLVDDGKPDGNAAFIPTTKDGTTSMYANGAVFVSAADVSSTEWQSNAVMFFLLGGLDRTTTAPPSGTNPLALYTMNAESVYISDVTLIVKEVEENPFARAGGTYIGSVEGKEDVICLDKGLWYSTTSEYADEMYENYAGITFSFYQPENTLATDAKYLALNFSTADAPQAGGWGNDDVQTTWNLGPYGHPKEGEDKWVSVYLAFDQMKWTKGNPFRIYAIDEVNYIADVVLAPKPDESNPFAVGGAEYVGNYNGKSGVYRIAATGNDSWFATDDNYTAWLYENYESVTFNIYQPGPATTGALYQGLLFTTMDQPTQTNSWGAGPDVVSTWNLGGYYESKIPGDTEWVTITLKFDDLSWSNGRVFKFRAMGEGNYIADVVLIPRT